MQRPAWGGAGVPAPAASHRPAYLDGVEVNAPLPTAWNPKDRQSTILVSFNNLQLTYGGQGKDEKDAAAIRANAPIPSSCPIFYYEIEVLDKGRRGFIGVGLSLESVHLHRLPGWEPHSYGYHGDDGHSFCHSGTGKPFGPKYSTGDVVGCGYNALTQSIFYTLNGTMVGVAFRDVKGPLFPTVGLRTPGEVVVANFGQHAFQFDISAYVESQRRELHQQVNTTDLSPLTGAVGMDALVLSYLVHHGFAKTSAALVGHVRAATGGKLPDADMQSQLELITVRQHIRDCLLSGDVDAALAATSSHFDGALAADGRLLFRLRCQKFAEMVRAGCEAGSDGWLPAALAYGQQLHDWYKEGLSAEDGRLLEDIFSLLAYSNPLQSPMQHLLEQPMREQLAVALNSAILVSLNGPAMPALDTMLRQLLVVTDDLRARCNPHAMLLQLPAELHK